MHFILSYDVDVITDAAKVAERIEEVLAAYKYVKRLSRLYIVAVNSEHEWEAVRAAVTRVAESIPETMYFIMSPVMNGGHYDGILNRGDWQDINTIAKA